MTETRRRHSGKQPSNATSGDSGLLSSACVLRVAPMGAKPSSAAETSDAGSRSAGFVPASVVPRGRAPTWPLSEARAESLLAPMSSRFAGTTRRRCGRLLARGRAMTRTTELGVRTADAPAQRASLLRSKSVGTTEHRQTRLHPADHKARRSVAAVFVAWYCIFWIAFGAVVPQWHMAFASHRHVYCWEYHRIEDAGPKHAPQRVADIRRAAESQLRAQATRGVDGDSGAACTFSNFSIGSATVLVGHGCRLAVASHRAPAVRVEAGGLPHRPVDVIVLSPKRGPPSWDA